MGEGPASFAVAGVKGRSSAFLADAFAFRRHPEPIRAERGWVRDLLLLSPLRVTVSVFCLSLPLPLLFVVILSPYVRTADG
jgi:hypothetical protein